MRRGENRSTRRKTSRSRVENQQTQPTYDAESGNRTRATLVGGERSDIAPTLLPDDDDDDGSGDAAAAAADDDDDDD